MSRSDGALRLAKALDGIGIRGSTDNPGSVAELVSATIDAYGRVDAVVNHTGGPPKGDLLALSDDDWDRVHRLVVKSVVQMARLVTPIMVKNAFGAWVNVTSYAAFEPSERFPLSSVYRAGLSAFTKL